MNRPHAFRFAFAGLSISAITLAAAALPALATSQEPVAPTAQAPALPTITALLDRELASRGGREAVEAVKQMTSRGAIEFKDRNAKAPLVVHVAEPEASAAGGKRDGKVLTVLTFDDGTEIRNGFNGEIGWAMDPALGPRILEGDELEQIRLTASVAGQSAIVSQYAKAEVIGETTWSGKPAYEVKLSGAPSRPGDQAASATAPVAERQATIYFEVATGRIIGMKSTLASARGDLPMVAQFLEFKEFAGPKGNITLPIRTEMSAMGMTNVITRSDVTFEPIDPSVFELPPPIKALVAKPAAQPQPSQPPAPPAGTPAATPGSSGESHPKG